MIRRKVRTAAASVAVIAGALTLFAACDWGSAPKAQTAADTGQGASAERDIGMVVYYDTYIRINPKDSKLSKFRVKEENVVPIDRGHEKHDSTYWHLSVYDHSTAKKYWDAIKDYGLKALGDKASIEYWFDERSWNHYDHYHWYLVVNDTKIAEYEKVGGTASAAYDHVRLLKSWWDYRR